PTARHSTLCASRNGGRRSRWLRTRSSSRRRPTPRRSSSRRFAKSMRFPPDSRAEERNDSHAQAHSALRLGRARRVRRSLCQRRDSAAKPGHPGGDRRCTGRAPSHADELCRRGAADCPARSLCRGRGRRRRGGIGMLSGGRCLRPRVHAVLSRGPRGLAPDLHERWVMTACWSRLILIAVFLLAPLGALAQAPQPAPTQPLLGAAELDQMLAPIALYPDPLLSEVLIASTYPLEVVQADRWAKANTK